MAGDRDRGGGDDYASVTPQAVQVGQHALNETAAALARDVFTFTLESACAGLTHDPGSGSYRIRYGSFPAWAASRYYRADPDRIVCGANPTRLIRSGGGVLNGQIRKGTGEQNCRREEFDERGLSGAGGMGGGRKRFTGVRVELSKASWTPAALRRCEINPCLAMAYGGREFLKKLDISCSGVG